MNKQCKSCVVSAGTHKPAEALHQQIAEPQPEALRLADECDESATHWVHEIDTRLKAAKMLRAQQARIAELEAICDEQQAGTERLRAQLAAQGVDVVRAAKALCKHAAKIQNINFDDYWLIHAEEFKEEAQIVLDAAQAKQCGKQCTSARES